MWPFKKSKKLKRDKYYYLKIVARCGPVADKWYAILQRSQDPAKVERILRHLHRIRCVQAGAMAKAVRM